MSEAYWFHPPVCALSLVLQHLGVYEDARAFCDWLEPSEWLDTRGAMETSRWLGIGRDTLAKLLQFHKKGGLLPWM